MRIFYNDWEEDYNIAFGDSIQVINTSHNKNGHYKNIPLVTINGSSFLYSKGKPYGRRRISDDGIGADEQQ